MHDATRIVVLPRFRVILTGNAGPEDAHAHLQAAAAVVLSPPARRYRVADAEYVADPAHIMLVNPMTEHHAIASGGPVLGVLMAPEFLAERIAAARGVNPLQPFGAVRAPLSEALRGRAERLAALIGDPASAENEIALSVAAFASAIVDTYATPASSVGPAFDFRIRRAIQAAAAEPGRVASVDDMLVASDLSRSRFFQLFRECTGLTPQMYIDAHQVEAAIEALTRSGKPIVRIARELGHTSPERFARYIRHMTGIGPRDFRRAAVRI
jgi:AraC family transcriptional regulator